MKRAHPRLRDLARRRRLNVFLGQSAKMLPTIGVDHPAGIVVLPSQDLSIRPKLFVHGSRSEFVVLQRAVQVLADQGRPVAGTTLVDVGANFGTTSLAALRLHGFGRAVACEPDPVAARHLRATAALNGLEQAVWVVEAAVADEVGRSRFRLGDMQAQGRLYGTGHLAAAADAVFVDEIEVEVVSLDALVDIQLFDPADVGLLWIDVQGAEGRVLAGARTLLERGVPVVAAVQDWAREAAGWDVFVELVESSYRLLVDVRRPSLKPPWSPAYAPVQAVRDLPARDTDLLFLP